MWKNVLLDLGIGSSLVAAYHFLFVNKKVTSYDSAIQQLRDAGYVTQSEPADLAKVKAEYIAKMKDRIAAARARQAGTSAVQVTSPVEMYKEEKK